MSKPVTDVAEIARGLTKAQREALVSGSATKFATVRTFERKFLSLGHIAVSDRGPFKIAITPLGLAVRAYLTQEQPR